MRSFVMIAVSIALAAPMLAGERHGECHHRHHAFEHFCELDKNADEKLTKDEFGCKDKVFDAIDVNKDGFVTAPELMASIVKARLERRDIDKDGRISREEFLKGRCDDCAGKAFARIDGDGDGVLSAREMLADLAKRYASHRKRCHR